MPTPGSAAGAASAAGAPKGSDVTARDLLDIVRLLPDVIFRCEKRADGAIVWTLNEGRLAEEFGIPTAKVRGKTLHEMFPKEQADKLLPHFEAAFRGETREFVSEVGGRQFKHLPQPVRDEAGNVIAVVGFISEVTSLVQAEGLIRQLNESMLQRVLELNEANARLADANRDLDRANRDLEAFSYTVSHDLRTPLTVLQNLLYVLEVKQGPHMDETARAQVKKMRVATRRMETLIADILQFSRAGRGDVKRDHVDGAKVAREVVALLDARDPDRRTEWDLPAALPLHADPLLLRIILDNLLGNAWKYTGQANPARIRLWATQQRGATVIHVEDNGVGFDPAHAARLFQPFQRLPGSEGFEGSGIGLATVARAVARHGGRIWAEGRPGQGATMHFTLDASGQA